MKTKPRTVFKIGIGLVGLLCLFFLGGYLYLMIGFPKVGSPPEIKIELTKARIERGKYLANHVALCIDCHSERNWKQYAGPIIPGTEGKGGEHFGSNMGLPGEFYAANITPFHLGKWTDGELLQAITEGINKKREPLFPIMPYPNFRHLSREDAYSIIAYLRTLKPISFTVPKRKIYFPMNLIIRTMPQPAKLKEKTPDPTDKIAYGKYIVTIASCAECHTPKEKGKPIPGMEFAGGVEFHLPDGTLVRSANITPDKETGIGNMSKKTFIDLFKSYAPENLKKTKFPKKHNTIMPWIMYAGMTKQDLGAIYEYLRTIKPVKNKVSKWKEE